MFVPSTAIRVDQQRTVAQVGLPGEHSQGPFGPGLARLIAARRSVIILLVTDNPKELESKFTKSLSNRRTENAGLTVLLRDRRHQVIARDLKRRVLETLGVPDAPVQAFDAVRTSAPVDTLNAQNLSREIDTLTLVEMKTTQKPIRDSRLEGFFFGVTESELALAKRLGDRYLFAFVVLNAKNVYGTEFFVLLTSEQLDARIRTKRVQYQVTLSRGLLELGEPHGVGPGELTKLGDE